MNLEQALKTNSFANEHHKMVLNIKYTTNWMNQIFSKKLGKYKISLQQFNVLRILRGAGKELNVLEVKKRMIEKTPNITRLMDKLCAANLIERYRCDQDRRVIKVKITDQGLKVLKDIDVDFSVINSFNTNLTLEEAKTVNHLLDKLRSKQK